MLRFQVPLPILALVCHGFLPLVLNSSERLFLHKVSFKTLISSLRVVMDPNFSDFSLRFLFTIMSYIVNHCFRTFIKTNFFIFYLFSRTIQSQISPCYAVHISNFYTPFSDSLARFFLFFTAKGYSIIYTLLLFRSLPSSKYPIMSGLSVY